MSVVQFFTVLEPQKQNTPGIDGKAPRKAKGKAGAGRRRTCGTRDLLKASIKTYRSASALRPLATQPIRTHPLQRIRSLSSEPVRTHPHQPIRSLSSEPIRSKPPQPIRSLSSEPIRSRPAQANRSLCCKQLVLSPPAVSFVVTTPRQPPPLCRRQNSRPDAVAPDCQLNACQEVVLNNVESWAELVKWAAGPGVMGPGGVAPSARSSKDSFQQFRRAALQKEREKALRGPDKISGQVPRDTPETPESAFPLDAILETPKLSDTSMTECPSPTATQPAKARTSLNRERDMARRKEQERRRLQAMCGIDMTMQRDIMSSFEKNLD
ncbi:Bromodomain testis-specific protein [Merluccius polli]|uniref:Bromodomain testis-specific protein n=1 Tax=Merluccius polli TaxID=89951 RepID=A0AA47NT84_MERPO|nr:Bromodomain testis-specific protein [Merluccius polli]